MKKQYEMEKENKTLQNKNERKLKMILNEKNQLGKIIMLKNKIEEDIKSIVSKENKNLIQRDLLISSLINESKEMDLMKEKLNQQIK